MPPESIQLAIFIVEEAIKAEPAIAAMLQQLFNKADPTPADWAQLRAAVAGKSYGDYVPDSALPVAEPVKITVLPAPEASTPTPPAQSQPAPRAESQNSSINDV